MLIFSVENIIQLSGNEDLILVKFDMSNEG